MTKIAKLVAVSLMTRVIVEESATEVEIVEAAKQRLIEKIRTECLETLEFIEDDKECPYDPQNDT